MRLSTVDQLLDLLDDVLSRHSGVDRTSRAAGARWSQLLGTAGHPLTTSLPDEPLVDWHRRGLLGDLRGARVLDVGCGNGRNAAWLAGQGAEVVGLDIAEELLHRVRQSMPSAVTLVTADVLRDRLPRGPFDLVHDSGCFHHLAPHRRITYLQRVLPLLAAGARFGIVTFAEEEQPCATDAQILAEGDATGGTSFTEDDLRAVFADLEPVEVRRVCEGVEGTFGAPFLTAGLFRAR